MSKLLRIGIDQDGVLSNFVQCFLDRANRMYDLNLQYQDIVDPKLENIVFDLLSNEKKAQTKTNMPYSVLSKIITEGLFEHLKPYPNAIEAVHKVASRYSVVFITKPFDLYHSPNEKSNWFKKYFSDIEYNLIFVDSFESKRMIDVDVLIDDEPRVLSALTTQLGVCVRQPWNERYLQESPKNVHSSVTGMGEVFEVLKKIEVELYE